MDGADGEGTGPPRGAVARATAFLGTAILLLALGLPLLRGGEDELPAPGSGARPPSPRPAVGPPGTRAPDEPAAAAGARADTVEAPPRVTSSLFPPWPGEEAAIVVVKVVRDVRGVLMPLPGARVSVAFPWEVAGGAMPLESVGATGPEGILEIAVRPWVSPEVIVEADGFAPTAAVRRWWASTAPRRTRFDATLHPAATVRGVVVDAESGAPVPGAVVEAACPGEAASFVPLSRALADASGAFSLDVAMESGLPIGHLRAAADGYAIATYAVAEIPRVLDAGEAAAGGTSLRVPLDRGHAIRGRVVDPEGRPVAGAQVVFDSVPWVRDPPRLEWLAPPVAGAATVGAWSIDSRAVTAADGGFEVRARWPGFSTTRVAARAPGFHWSAEVAVDLPEGPDPVPPVELRLRPAGRVVVSLFDHGGAPLLVSPPELWGEDDRLQFRGTAPGRWEAEPVPPGRWTIVGSDANGDSGLFREAIEVVAGGTVERILRPGDPERAVEGRVVDDEGAPVAGASVEAWSARAGPIASGSAATDGEGRFRVPGLLPGPTLVTATDDVTAIPAVEARTGGPPVTLVLPRPARVRLRLVGPGDEAVRFGATLHPGNGNGTAIEYEGAVDGMVLMLDARTRLLGIRASGRTPLEVPLDLAPGSEADLGTITFAPAVPVQGRVVDAAGEPVASVTVRRASDRGWRPAAVDDETGAFELLAEAAPYTVTVSAPWFLAREITIPAAADARDLEVRLDRGAVLSVEPTFAPVRERVEWTARAVPLREDGTPSGEPVAIVRRDEPFEDVVGWNARVPTGRWRIEALRKGVVLHSLVGDAGEGETLRMPFEVPAR
jgi:protocatechuate 3,4-dioxygenase beta subunit